MTQGKVWKDDWNAHWTSLAAATELNPAQAYRRKLILEALALRSAASPVRFLDLGSGTGDLASEVSRYRPDAEILGLDLSASGVEMSRKKVPGGQFLQRDFTKPIDVADYHGWATHAVCSEVLEHVDDPAAVLRNVRSLLAPGCKLVITVPAGPMSAFDKHIGHRRHYSPSRLEQILTDAGLDVTHLRGAGFPFFNAYRLVVIARGKKLIEDTAASGEDGVPWLARATMRAFSWLFLLNSSKTKLGWQLVAVGTEPR